MGQIVDRAFQQREKLEKAKKEQEDWLEYVKKQLETCSDDSESQIKKITAEVKAQVTEAMTEEIGRLGLRVNEFNHPFDPDPVKLRTYKKELYSHLERDLGRNMTACCSNSQTQAICKGQRDMADRLRGLLPPKSPEVSLEPGTPALDFQASYKLDVPSLCTDFQEDIEFHFILGWQAILTKFRAPHNAGQAIALRANIQRNVQSLVPTDQQVTLASLASHPATLVVIVGGLIWKTGGWKCIALCGGVCGVVCGSLYGGVYAIERLCWTNSAKEETFKRQFVEYASKKLQSEVNVASANCGTQVQQELTSTFDKLKSLVQRANETLKKNITERCNKITRLKEIENDAKILRNKASWFESELTQFVAEFGLEKSKM